MAHANNHASDHDRAGSLRRALAACIAFAVIGSLIALALTRGSDEDVALAQARRQRDAGGREAAFSTLTACAKKSPAACRCADEAAALAIDLGRYPQAWSLVDAAKCPPLPRHRGERAEALVAVARTAEGAEEADAVLAKDPSEPHACFARAWAMAGSRDGAAVPLAERAVAGGRGMPAILLLGTLLLEQSDTLRAHDAFARAAKLDPTDARPVYDLALAAQRQGRYGEAREGYLRALALDPKLADARYNLALLTHEAGADDEARHDLDELARIAPNDPRIPALAKTLGQR